jgi:hypothetical protein
MLLLSCWALGNTSLKLVGGVMAGGLIDGTWAALEALKDADASEGPLPRATGLGSDPPDLGVGPVIFAELPNGGTPGLVLGEGGEGVVLFAELLLLGLPMTVLPRGGLTIIGGLPGRLAG